ncbi:hypothetical protein HYPSUDRAFT_956338 [Hypholoma sublateritium FD-334 SS-4]|uniref:Uncharacterized protein n=1 Tax=Hypholoma sublateritium (strain FD-334 SS-4) TaxID=945553 RepID=A0A0D2PDT5_HYPSF|nr:hypothetical protein HYPSUDRAFT_956338 [Hypholoma sublateritium FD-334 SS-4]
MSILSTLLRSPTLRSSRSYAGRGAKACVLPSLLPSAPRTPRSFLWSSIRAFRHDLIPSQTVVKLTPQLHDAAAAIIRSPQHTFYGKMQKPGVARQVVFVAITCGLVLTFAAVRTTIETDCWTQKMLLLIPHFEVWGPKNASNEYLKGEAKKRYTL